MANFLGFSDEEIENNRKEQIKQEVIKKWEDSGLLDGFENINRTNMALLLESESSQLIYKDFEPKNKIKKHEL